MEHRHSPFGWSYPPGADLDPNAPYNQEDPPCDVCAQHVDNCICPECPVCGDVGNSDCYIDTMPMIWDDGWFAVPGKKPTHNHGMVRSLGQTVLRQLADDEW